jgi:hypothetical protein
VGTYTYTDEWGCAFTVAEPGVIGEVKSPPLADQDDCKVL